MLLPEQPRETKPSLILENPESLSRFSFQAELVSVTSSLHKKETTYSSQRKLKCLSLSLTMIWALIQIE